MEKQKKPEFQFKRDYDKSENEAIFRQSRLGKLMEKFSTSTKVSIICVGVATSIGLAALIPQKQQLQIAQQPQKQDISFYGQKLKLLDQQESVGFIGKFKTLYIAVSPGSQEDKRTVKFANTLNGVTDNGYWYQLVLVQTKKDNKTHMSVVNEGFDYNGLLFYEKVFELNEKAKPNDIYNLFMQIKNGRVFMSVSDVKTGEFVSNYIDAHNGSYFVGSPKDKGMFTGVMNEMFSIKKRDDAIAHQEIEAPSSYHVYVWHAPIHLKRLIATEDSFELDLSDEINGTNANPNAKRTEYFNYMIDFKKLRRDYVLINQNNTKIDMYLTPNTFVIGSPHDGVKTSR